MGEMTIIEEYYGVFWALRGDDVFPCSRVIFDAEMRRVGVRYLVSAPTGVSAADACEQICRISGDAPEGYDLSERIRHLGWSFREEWRDGEEWRVAVAQADWTPPTEVPDLANALMRWSKSTGVLVRPEYCRASDAMGDFLRGLFQSLRVLGGLTPATHNLARAKAQCLLRRCGACLDVLRSIPEIPCREAEAYWSLRATGFTLGAAVWSLTPSRPAACPPPA